MSPKGLLLINLGTPEEPTKKKVSHFLSAFLSDPRVIDLPKCLRLMLVYLFIIPFRTRRSTEAYRAIWSKQGSPLFVYTHKLAQALKKCLPEYAIEVGMRYSEPSIKTALKKLKAQGCQEITVFPLYPQYASSSTGSALEEVMRCLSHEQMIPALHLIRDYFNHPAYIKALATRIHQTLQEYAHTITPNHPFYFLFSYHGIPERQLLNYHCATSCDRLKPCPEESSSPLCYRAQCYETSRLTAKRLNFSVDQYTTSFQSRLGRIPWIGPYTEDMLKTLANKGIKNLAIICPSFTADCLETLEEIGIRAREDWKLQGGESLLLIPCLNADPTWVEGIVEILQA